MPAPAGHGGQHLAAGLDDDGDLAHDAGDGLFDLGQELIFAAQGHGGQDHLDDDALVAVVGDVDADGVDDAVVDEVVGDGRAGQGVEGGEDSLLLRGQLFVEVSVLSSESKHETCIATCRQMHSGSFRKVGAGPQVTSRVCNAACSITDRSRWATSWALGRPAGSLSSMA